MNLQTLVFVSIIGILNPALLPAQNDKSISFNTTYSGLLNGAIMTPSYTIVKPKSNLSIGPTFLWSIGDQQESRDKFKLTGLQGTIQCFPTRTESKLNLYFQGDLILQRIKDEATSVVYNINTSSFEPFEFSKTENLIQLYVGYGLEWKLGDNFALNQSIGLGTIFNSRSTQSGFEDFSDKFFDTDWMIRVGLTRNL